MLFHSVREHTIALYIIVRSYTMLSYSYWSGGELIVDNIHDIERFFRSYLKIFPIVYHMVTFWDKFKYIFDISLYLC